MVVNVLDELIAYAMLGARQPMESFIHLETADDRSTFASVDGSLVSIVKVLGSKQIVGDEEYRWLVDQSTIKLGARFDRPGYAMQLYFMRDPSAVGIELDRLLVPNRAAAKAVGLDLADTLSERRLNLARYTAHEDIYLALWTRPSALPETEYKKALKARGKIKWVNARRAQYPFAALEELRQRHKSFTSAVTAALEELSIKTRVMEVHEALAAVRTSLYPMLRNDQWRANLPGDPLKLRKINNVKDYSDVLWPPIRHQLCIGDAEVISPTIARIGDMLWTSIDVSLAPTEPSPFPIILNRLIDAETPFRMSFLVEGGGADGLGFKRFLSSVLGFSNSVNKEIKRSLDSLGQYAQNNAVIKWRMSFATFAPMGERKLLESRAASLMQAIEAWGYAQATMAGGDPLACVMSSSLGIACASTAPPVVAPLVEMFKMFPWQRACSPFEEGSVIFRTPDGRLWPYQSGTTLTTTWFDLIFAQPGSGKSVLMNAMSLGTCLSAGVSRLPFIAILDIGPSSSGLISLIRDSLPLDRRHEAMHFKLRMTPEYAVNPFDTQLGCRYPLPDERAYLSELMTLLCTPPGQQVPYDGMTQLIGFVIDEMYRWRNDTGANAEARPYLPRVEYLVDEALQKYNVHLPPEPYWWEVVDALYDLGLYHEAMLAQRHAVPTLVDAVTAARRPQIRTFLEETQVGASAETVIHAFERMIASAVREFPILASVTRFDVGGARVCAVDLQDVSPQGDDAADRQTSIMYMLARHAMIRAWWLGPDALRNMPERYKPYHEARIKEIRETPKRLCYDEFHRTSKTASVRAQVIRDVREGRKWGVQIVLSSQLLDDFTPEMVDLATGVWICGSAVSERAIKATAERFGLSDTATWVMRYRLTGPRPSGAPVLMLLSTVEGRYEQHLINTLGPVELWALSTSAEDVALRTRLYERLGASRARLVLAQNFPGGTARHEIRRRVVNRTERGEIESGATAQVIDDLANEMAAQVLQTHRLA